MLTGPAESIAKDVERTLRQELQRVGLLFRLFARVKNKTSIQDKFQRKKYSEAGKRMQDLIGLRITLYFSDDVEIVKEVLRKRWQVVEFVRDMPSGETFGPTRFNCVCQLPRGHAEVLRPLLSGKAIDTTFEVQIRTMLSEGWHEVEHDLRYKCHSDWDSHDDLSRTLNGILATLETCDWSMLSLFDQLGYRHYKDGEYEAMLRHKFRIRLASGGLSKEVVELLDNDKVLAKSVYKVDRKTVLLTLVKEQLRLPFTAENVLHLANATQLRRDELRKLESRPVSEILRPLWGRRRLSTVR